ncbi:MAG: endonuclease MutS2 [Campylobacterales bacterium]
MTTLLAKLDLIDYFNSFESFLARPKSFVMEGDVNVHHRMIQDLEEITLREPPKLPSLSESLMRLNKGGVLDGATLWHWGRMIDYFVYLKKLPVGSKLKEWLESIVIPNELMGLGSLFDEQGRFKDSNDERLEGIAVQMNRLKESMRQQLSRLLSDARLAPYLVDRQLHLVEGEEALLLRGGFSAVLKGRIVGRTPAGFFYVIPQSLHELNERMDGLKVAREEVLIEHYTKLSRLLAGWQKFLAFLDRSFDRFDHLQARLAFARAKDAIFVLPRKGERIVLQEFCHPALLHPKPVSVDFSRSILFITGVNAGGKTMLLKSILAAAFMAKYLIPMRIKEGSIIGSFSEIVAILDDPQNVKNDISTFAGRMKEFSRLFHKQGVLVGVDEIELGTDADEAASLFKVILEKLLERHIKIVITTHHKRLASLMASSPAVEMIAALFDEENRLPTFTFLQGTIGKSYAFETALRYGIPHGVVAQAKEHYGEDKERLNELIERSTQLESELRAKTEALEKELRESERLNERLREEEARLLREMKETKARLEGEYRGLLKEAREAIKEGQAPDISRYINKASDYLRRINAARQAQYQPEFRVGSYVGYGHSKGRITALSGTTATIDVDGRKLKVETHLLKDLSHLDRASSRKAQINFPRPTNAPMVLDLHGLRVDEALEKLDKFLSDALMARYEEVMVYHGIGSGKLGRAVGERLAVFPGVESFHDAPPSMGGFGAKIIRLIKES